VASTTYDTAADDMPWRIRRDSIARDLFDLHAALVNASTRDEAAVLSLAMPVS
jgi:hypothetical protein